MDDVGLERERERDRKSKNVSGRSSRSTLGSPEITLMTRESILCGLTYINIS
jgi:hypothetical protein